MKRGTKPLTRSQKLQRGTLQPCRDPGESYEVPTGEVEPPDGLPLEALAIWTDTAPIAIKAGMLKPCDRLLFGHWCSMSSQIQMAWQAGGPVPAAFIAEWRRLGELFGLAGEKSRIGRPAEPDEPNPFERFKKPIGRPRS